VKVLTESVGPSAYFGQFGLVVPPAAPAGLAALLSVTPSATRRSSRLVTVALGSTPNSLKKAACSAGLAANFPPMTTRLCCRGARL
jgi:hypothetical protein